MLKKNLFTQSEQTPRTFINLNIAYNDIKYFMNNIKLTEEVVINVTNCTTLPVSKKNALSEFLTQLRYVDTFKKMKILHIIEDNGKNDFTPYIDDEFANNFSTWNKTIRVLNIPKNSFSQEGINFLRKNNTLLYVFTSKDTEIEHNTLIAKLYDLVFNPSERNSYIRCRINEYAHIMNKLIKYHFYNKVFFKLMKSFEIKSPSEEEKRIKLYKDIENTMFNSLVFCLLKIGENNENLGNLPGRCIVNILEFMSPIANTYLNDYVNCQERFNNFHYTLYLIALTYRQYIVESPKMKLLKSAPYTLMKKLFQNSKISLDISEVTNEAYGIIEESISQLDDKYLIWKFIDDNVTETERTMRKNKLERIRKNNFERIFNNTQKIDLQMFQVNSSWVANKKIIPTLLDIFEIRKPKSKALQEKIIKDCYNIIRSAIDLLSQNFFHMPSDLLTHIIGYICPLNKNYFSNPPYCESRFRSFNFALVQIANIYASLHNTHQQNIYGNRETNPDHGKQDIFNNRIGGLFSRLKTEYENSKEFDIQNYNKIQQERIRFLEKKAKREEVQEVHTNTFIRDFYKQTNNQSNFSSLDQNRIDIATYPEKMKRHKRQNPTENEAENGTENSSTQEAESSPTQENYKTSLPLKKRRKVTNLRETVQFITDDGRQSPEPFSFIAIAPKRKRKPKNTNVEDMYANQELEKEGTEKKKAKKDDNI